MNNNRGLEEVVWVFTNAYVAPLVWLEPCLYWTIYKLPFEVFASWNHLLSEAPSITWDSQVPRSHCIPCVLIIPSLSFPPVPSYLPKPLPRCSLERMGHSSAKSTQYSLSLNTVRSALRQQKSRCYLKLSYKNHRAYGKKQYGGRIVKKFVCDISEKHRNQKQWRNLTPVRWWKKT